MSRCTAFLKTSFQGFAIAMGCCLAQSPCQAQDGLTQPIVTKDGLGIRTVCVDAADDVWLVSARDFVCSGDGSCLETKKLISGCWHQQSVDRLMADHTGDKSRATVIYVHGNRTSLENAQSRGLQVYENLFGDLCSRQRPPIRFVVFAWKSECELIRVLPDYQLKSERAYELQRVFADFLARFSDREMVVTGFSLGCQVVLGGLTAPTCPSGEKSGDLCLALIAPALNPRFTCKGLQRIPHQPNVKRTAVFINRNDKAVQVAERLVRQNCKQSATTLRQLASQVGESNNSIEIFDMTDEVTKRHSVIGYTSQSCSLQNEILAMVRSVHCEFGTQQPTGIGCVAKNNGREDAPKTGAFGLQNGGTSLR